MDLDDEELKATRKLNGIDKNVGSIEEDIKILEDFTKIVKGKDYNAKNGWHGYYDDELMNLGTAIEHLIKAYKDLKEELETEQNERLLCHIREKQMIPVQKVEETIDNFRDKTVWGYNDWKYDENVYKAELNIIDKLAKELLEKRK